MHPYIVDIVAFVLLHAKFVCRRSRASQPSSLTGLPALFSFQDGGCDEEVGDDPKAMQFAKMDVPEEYMATNDEELVLKLEQVRSPIRSDGSA